MAYFNGIYVQLYDPHFLAETVRQIQATQNYLRYLEQNGRQGSREYLGYQYIIEIYRMRLRIGTEEVNMVGFYRGYVLLAITEIILQTYLNVEVPDV